MSAPEDDINALPLNFAQAADELMARASESVNELLDTLPGAQADTMQKRPTLVAVHALLQQSDLNATESLRRHDEIVDYLQNIQESIDFKAATPEDDPDAETTRHHQAAKDYDRLKWLVDKAMPNMSETEYQEMNSFIQRLSGL